jgi:Transposase IS116/IS110/IS902 family
VILRGQGPAVSDTLDHATDSKVLADNAPGTHRPGQHIRYRVLERSRRRPSRHLFRTLPGFKSGRHLAARLGLTPRSHSSGGKERLGNPGSSPCLVVGPASRAERVRVHRHGFTPGIALVRDRWRFRWDDDLRRRSGWSRRSNGVVAVSNPQGITCGTVPKPSCGYVRRYRGYFNVGRPAREPGPKAPTGWRLTRRRRRRSTASPALLRTAT